MDSSYNVPPVYPSVPPPQPPPESRLKKVLGPFAVIGVLLAKFKAFLIPALKWLPLLLKTGGTMLISVFVYAMSMGWPVAVGFVLLLLVHECGHLIAAKKVGLPVSAPMFIPFMGAFIALKDQPRNAWIEAQVGIGGPLLGSAGAAVCLVIYYVTGWPLFAVLAFLGFFLNLFNLAPVGFLDGGRIASAISPWLWVIGIVIIGLMLLKSFSIVLAFIFITSLPRLFSLFRPKTEEERRYFEVTPQQRLTMGVLYIGLAVALVAGMHLTTILSTRHMQEEQHQEPATIADAAAPFAFSAKI